MIWGLGSEVLGSGFRAWGSGDGVWSSGFRMLGLSVQCLVLGTGCLVFLLRGSGCSGLVFGVLTFVVYRCLAFGDQCFAFWALDLESFPWCLVL